MKTKILIFILLFPLFSVGQRLSYPYLNTSDSSRFAGSVFMPNLPLSTVLKVVTFDTTLRKLGYGKLTAISPLSYTGGAFSISKANTSTPGYLSSADWNYFNSKVSSPWVNSGDGYEIDPGVAKESLFKTGKVRMPGLTVRQEQKAVGYDEATGELTVQDAGAGSSQWTNVGTGDTTISFLGRIGVGTTAPESKMDVNGQLTVTSLRLRNTPLEGSQTLTKVSSTGGLTPVVLQGARPISVTGTTDMTIAIPKASSTDSGYLTSGDWTVFSDKVSSPFTFDSNATDVTISRTAPADLALELKSTGDDQNALVKFSNGNGSHLAQVGIYGPYANGLDLSTSGADVINFRQNNVLKAQITGAGDFSVTNGLNVGGTVTGSKMVGGSAVGSTLTLQSTTGAGTTDYIAFKTGNNVERMRILSDGKMGIGKTNPGELLDVNGRIRAASLIQASGGLGTLAGGFCTLSTNDVGFFGNVSTGDASAVSFWSKNLERMRLDPSGNVGINTTAPTAKIHVANGTIKVTGTGSDSVTVGVNKSLQLYGNATAWDDLAFQATQLKTIGALNKPDFDLSNLGLLFPRNDTTEIIGIVVQMPHRWREGTSIGPHVHWVQTSADTATWKIKYRVYNIGEAIPTTWTIITSSNHATPYTSGTIHQIAEFPSISMTGKTFSCIVDVLVYRNDNLLAGDALMKMVDFHFEVGSLGTDNEYSNN